MANESTENGFLYLVDASTDRQYALEIKNGEPTLPLHVYGKPLLPGETIYAFDDNVKKDGNTVTTAAYQIKQTFKDEKGVQHYNLGVVDVTYKATPLRDPRTGTTRTTLDLTPESKKDAEAEGFTALPSHYDHAERRGAAVSVFDLASQHPEGKADKARADIAKLYAKTNPKSTFNTATQPKKTYKISDADLKNALKKYSRDLTEEAQAGRLDPVIGRDAETKQALEVLTRRKQGSLCFTGDAGVGKTAMFSAIAQRIADDVNLADDDEGKLPKSLQGAHVIQLDLQSMTAGSRYRGDFEERLKPIVEGLTEREGILEGKKVILAIDEIHAQLKSGSSDSSSDAGNMMKPMLTSKGISVMGATTDDEYRKYIESDGALASRFEKMRLLSTDPESTKEILRNLWPLTKEHNNLTEDLSEEDIEYIVTMTNRYAPQESQPRKGEKVMNMAAAAAEFEHHTSISRANVIAAVAQMSGLSPEFLSQGDAERFLNLENELPKKILGQDEATRFITDHLITARSGLNDPSKPWGFFVMQGPPGTGKTQTAKDVAEYLFGNESALIKLDGGEYKEAHTVSRLIGSPPGYVGYDDAPALTEQVRQHPYCVVLIDEIEKMHPDVLNILLAPLNDGKMTDSHGRTVLFNNVIFMATSNAGSAKVMEILEGKDNGMSFGSSNKAVEESKKKERINNIYSDSIKLSNGGPFKPEMISRIKSNGGFVIFQPLTQQVINDLVVNEVKKINTRLNSSGGANVPNVTVEVAQSALDKLAKEGYSPALGAREMEGTVQSKLSQPLAKWLLRNKEKIEAFVQKEGAAKIVIDSVDTFEPKLVKAVSNDNKAEAKKAANAAPSA